MPRSVTIHNVAAKAGVSIKTVSRVVNRETGVSPRTAERVESAIAELNYRPNPSARSLAGRRSFLIGFLYDNSSDSYLTKLQAGILDVCHSRGYSLSLAPFNYKDPGIATHIRHWVKQNNIDGIIVTPPLSDSTIFMDVISQENVALVAVSSRSNNQINAVVIDDEAAAFAMTRHLLDAGHTRIGFVKGHPDHHSSRLRLNGFQRALHSAGLSVAENLIAEGFFDFQSGLAAGKILLERRDRPTAIFASNDDMAAGVMNVAYRMHIPMPEELAVTGFDDTPISQQVWPAMTTIRQPIRRMGMDACDLLIKSIEGKVTTPTLSHHSFQLKERGSSLKDT